MKVGDCIMRSLMCAMALLCATMAADAADIRVGFTQDALTLDPQRFAIVSDDLPGTLASALPLPQPAPG